MIYVASTETFSDNHVHTSENCDAQVCIQANADFYGSIVASSVDFTGGQGSLNFDYDPDLADLDGAYPDGYEPPPQVTYLNVAHHEVIVENT